MLLCPNTSNRKALTMKSVYPVPNYPLPFYPVPFLKRVSKKFAPFAVCSIPSETDADDIPVELYSPARSIVTAVVKGEGFRRLDVGSISLNGGGIPAFLLGHDFIEHGVGSYESGPCAWLSLYIPSLDRGVSPDQLEFGTFSVNAVE